MRVSIFILLLISMALAGTSLAGFKVIQNKNAKIELKDDEIYRLKNDSTQLMKTIHFKDSVHRDHLSTCSYVSNDQFEITKDRYLKVRLPSRTIH